MQDVFKKQLQEMFGRLRTPDRTITQKEVDEACTKHFIWLFHEDEAGIVRHNDFWQRALFIDKDLKSLNFSYKDLAGAWFINCNFDGADFRYSNLTDARLDGSLVDGANFEGAVGVFICRP